MVSIALPLPFTSKSDEMPRLSNDTDKNLTPNLTNEIEPNILQND